MDGPQIRSDYCRFFNGIISTELTQVKNHIHTPSDVIILISNQFYLEIPT